MSLFFGDGQLLDHYSVRLATIRHDTAIKEEEGVRDNHLLAIR